MPPTPANASTAPAAASTNAQGYSADASDPAALRSALQLACDYRGDVTVTRLASNSTVEGYVFDCKTDRASGELLVRLIPSGADERITIAFSDIARIDFTGRDTASGKSFETWIKKYVERKMAGESASIESESLD